ncbi:hypothetical protein [Actinocorallia aurantiaca]|uniref:Uncharacterized protein n=1 Tax=Actinocorallia aurantiaca TaxID=46204 RepID=A0ABN3UIR2_9ACTN
MRAKTRMLAFSAVATAVIVPLSALPAHAETYVYKNSTQVAGNYAGVVFYPYGDNFKVWNNVAGGRAFVSWNYKDIDDSWKNVGTVFHDQSPRVINVEMVEGRQIYFKVTWTDEYNIAPASPIVYFRTGGANP